MNTAVTVLGPHRRLLHHASRVQISGAIIESSCMTALLTVGGNLSELTMAINDNTQSLFLTASAQYLIYKTHHGSARDLCA